MSDVVKQSFDSEKPPSLDGERRHRFELSSPYGPDGESWLKRSYAATVLREVRSNYEEMRSQDPDLYVGLMAYGSAVKGRFHEKSDLDLLLFVDPDVAELRGDDISEAGERVRKYIYDGLRGAGFSHEIDGLPKTLFALGMNERIAEASAMRALEDLNRMREVIDNSGGLPEGKKINFANFIDDRIKCLFYLQISGGKIDIFRKELLDTLWSFEDDGEIIWDAIAGSLVSFEEGRRKADIYFPSTLKKAYSYFRLEEPRFTLFEFGGNAQQLVGGGVIRLVGSKVKTLAESK